jgi:hypothetical protein
VSKLVYVASSWKNADALDPVHIALKAVGLETWDFRNNGFWWRHVSRRYLGHPFSFPRAPESRAAFAFDRKGLDLCDGVFVVQPAGVATALEAGYAAGRGKPVVVWGTAREERLDIMWNFAAALLPADECDLHEAVARMRGWLESGRTEQDPSPADVEAAEAAIRARDPLPRQK